MKAFDLASSESIKYFSKVNANIYLAIILSIFKNVSQLFPVIFLKQTV